VMLARRAVVAEPKNVAFHNTLGCGCAALVLKQA
jgi:hypothetical protein